MALPSPPTSPTVISPRPPLLHALHLGHVWQPPHEPLWSRRQDAPPALTLLHPLSLTLAAGDTLGIVGASGAGKSLLARILAGRLRPSHGQVWLHGQPLYPPPAAPTLMGRLRWPTRPAAVPRAAIQWLGTPSDDDTDSPPTPTAVPDSLLPWLAALDLDAEHAARPAHQLSGGQGQRLALARALHAQPQLLLVDDALSELDRCGLEQALALLDQASQHHGCACVLLGQSLAPLAGLCQQLLVLDQGQVVEQGQRQQLLQHPQHPLTQALVAEYHDTQDLPP